MDLSPDQKAKVSEWLTAGANLAEVQRRLADEFGIHITYMEARFLIDDLRLSFKEPEPAPQPEPAPAGEANAAPGPDDAASDEAFPGLPPAAQGGKVSVSVDSITRPGAVVSGSVTFSDGKGAAWYLDQTGRLGMTAHEPGYRPPQEDIPEFQATLEQELMKLGF